MERRSILFHRIPIIQRTAIYPRKPCYSKQVNCKTCKLCGDNQDCNGKQFIHVPDLQEGSGNPDVHKIIYLSDEVEHDWDEIENMIWQLDEQKQLLRLITDVNIPQKVLWAASYNAQNILQINVDMLHYQKVASWVRKLVFNADKCGVYCVLFLHPIIPDVVKTYDVLDLIHDVRNHKYIHFDLKFGEFEGIEEIDGYLNFNGKPVSSKYLTKNSQGFWQCTEEYLNLFLKKIQIYTEARNVSVAICGITEDCTGLGV